LRSPAGTDVDGSLTLIDGRFVPDQPAAVMTLLDEYLQELEPQQEEQTLERLQEEQFEGT
jgi:hypothetical protein